MHQEVIIDAACITRQETDLERKLWETLGLEADTYTLEATEEVQEQLVEIKTEFLIRGLSGLDPELLEDDDA